VLAQCLAHGSGAGPPSRTRTQAYVTQPICIGDWTVEPQGNELRRGGESVRIEPKAMDLLVLLAAHAGRVVTREEIFAAVWPRVVVGDEALTQGVIKLRRALGDNPRAPVYIETIAKRGYRLIATVAPAPRAGSSERLQPASSTDGSRRLRPRWIVLPALVAIALAAYLVVAPKYFTRTPADVAAADDAQAAPIAVSIAPFETLEPSDEQTRLAHALGDDLATDLSRMSGLRLIRGGAAGSARYGLSGTVTQSAGTLRVNLSLVDSATGEQLWAGRFERPYGDLFALQDEIARKVLDVLPAKIDETERMRVARRYTRSLAAYEAFQRGQELFLARTRADNERARDLFRKAIELDPAFARAYASLAMTYALEPRLTGSADSAQALDRALELANTARLIDPDEPQVYWALGFVHAQSRRHDQAIEALQHAIAIDASFADAYALLGGVRTYIGQPRESIALLRTAMRLNPNSGYLYFLLLGRAYLFEDDLEQALVNLRAAAMRNPADVETRVFLAATLTAAGDLGAARWQADEVRTLQPAFTAREWLDLYPMTSVPQRQRLAALLRTVGL
jgi:DNA-binding winged helix-turn-helix (wHTH) protein/TolB-like protein/Tfp pilus assembly protein PilF